MTDLVSVAWIAFGAAAISATPPTIAALIGKRATKKIHKELNSRLTQWKEETKAANVEAVIAAYERGKKDQKTNTETRDIIP